MRRFCIYQRDSGGVTHYYFCRRETPKPESLECPYISLDEAKEKSLICREHSKPYWRPRGESE